MSETKAQKLIIIEKSINSFVDVTDSSRTLSNGMLLTLFIDKTDSSLDSITNIKKLRCHCRHFGCWTTSFSEVHFGWNTAITIRSNNIIGAFWIYHERCKQSFIFILDENGFFCLFNVTKQLWEIKPNSNGNKNRLTCAYDIKKGLLFNNKLLILSTNKHLLFYDLTLKKYMLNPRLMGKYACSHRGYYVDTGTCYDDIVCIGIDKWNEKIKLVSLEKDLLDISFLDSYFNINERNFADKVKIYEKSQFIFSNVLSFR